MNILEWIQSLMPVKREPTPAQKPKPWEDPNRSEQDRQAWREAEPKSLRRSA